MNHFLDKINWPLCLGVLAGVIAIFSALAQWNENKIANKENKQAQDSLKLLNQKTFEKTEEIANLYKTIAQLQESLGHQVTGGNSMPYYTYMFIIKPNVKMGELNIAVNNPGKYPIKDLKAQIFDSYDKIVGIYGLKEITIGNIRSGHVSIIYQSHFSLALDNLHYNIQTEWLNGAYVGTIKLSRNQIGKYELKSVTAFKDNKYVEPKYLLNVQIIYTDK